MLLEYLKKDPRKGLKELAVNEFIENEQFSFEEENALSIILKIGENTRKFYIECHSSKMFTISIINRVKRIGLKDLEIDFPRGAYMPPPPP